MAADDPKVEMAHVELSQRSGPQLSGVGYLYALVGRRTEALGILKEREERYARGEAVGQSLAAVWTGLRAFFRTAPGRG